MKKFTDIAGLFASLKVESDRASIILAAAFLDSFLGDCMARRFSGHFDGDLFRGDGALGTFSRRISMARALGWIHEDTASDLDIVRKIRNDFAHDYDHTLSFSTDSVTARCQNLSTVRAMQEAIEKLASTVPDREHLQVAARSSIAQIRTPRDAFELATMVLAAAIAEIVPSASEMPFKPKGTAELASRYLQELLGEEEA
jgi:DNA-binding MltR family transcriptional regulator